jgi:hypothetical protein
MAPYKRRDLDRGQRILVNVIAFVNTLLLARLLTPGDFGLVAIAISGDDGRAIPTSWAAVRPKRLARYKTRLRRRYCRRCCGSCRPTAPESASVDVNCFFGFGREYKY